MKKISFIPILFLVLCSCGRDRRLIFFSDPYLNSFQGRGIKYMISFDPDDSVFADTATFDQSGNIVYLKAFGLKERRAYDSLRFIKRILRINDIPANYFIKYYFDRDGYLIQEWNEINHLDWSFNKSDLKKISRIVKFKIDKDGRIMEEIDTAANQFTLFTYKKNEGLMSKEVFSINPKNSLQRWEYIYNKPSQLKMIKFNVGEQNFSTQYYSEGLLDSTVYNSKGYTIKYRYLFY